MSTLLIPPPTFTPEAAQEIALERFAILADVTPLASERDQNFKLVEPDGRAWVLKIANAAEDRDYLDMQVALLRHLEAVDPGLPLPRVHATVDGADLASLTAAGGHEHAVRVVSYIEGVPLARSSKPADTLRSLGETLGRLDQALQSFGHAAAHRRAFLWDIRQTLQSRARLSFVGDPARRALVGRLLDRFERQAAPLLPRLRAGVIHNDANDWNVLVQSADGGPVTALTDLGDTMHTTVVNELAIALAYVMLDTPSPLETAAHVVAGFHAAFPLEEREIEVLPELLAGRLAISVTMSAMRAEKVAGNPYLAISERPAWDLIARLDAMGPAIVRGVLRQACGLEAAAGARAALGWLARNRDHLAPILEPPPGRQRQEVLALSDPADPLVLAMASPDPERREAVWRRTLAERRFDLGLGPWGEQRRVYTTDAFKSRLALGDRRDVHLGLDLFLDAGSPVATPLEATVVDVRVCPDPQDYGGCVLLEHAPGPGVRFRTLWGHLAPASIAHLKPGQRLPRGQRFARLGAYEENGGWLPHLHLQLVLSGEADAGAVIGVGELRFLGLWQELYPDPATLAGLAPEAFAPRGRDLPALLEERTRRLGGNLSIAYRAQPLKIVRGEDVWLTDHRGRAYLDCFNNVAHVGHCHPRVVSALASQAWTLNTNTRYLSDLIIDYAERLTRSLPEPLRVCYFVTSGSEANDLAVRMAKAHTRRQDFIVVDWAYHGHTEALIGLSPYKYKRAGGAGRPAHVHEVPLPDVYRAPGHWPAGEVGLRFAAPVAETAQRLAREGRPPAAFMAETAWSCGGQVFAPEGYFRAAYGAAKQAGAVTIADEVQIGFGRLGKGLWGFERHGVVPDILTLGKPIGNGHPMAALVTTPEIARSFANGMEYFATFGGNPVSCAVGLAVLDVIEDERLIENAARRGAEILAGCRRLAERFPAIGDVRGEGLFLGLDLVKDRAGKAHDGATAERIAMRMRELGVLIGTDGPHDNVLKIRPPMTLREEHVRLLLATLEQAFSDVAR